MLLPPIAPERASDLITAFTRAHVLVVGDAMLDTFIVGPVTRISPEAPVPVLRFDHELHRIGGAANVAHNVVALGGEATLIAVTGQDEKAGILTRACRDAGIAPVFVSDTRRPTTTKVRVVTDRKQQVARVDYEIDTPIEGDVEQRLIAEIHARARRASAVLISDYAKGCVTAAVVRAAIEAAGDRVPVLVDPKIPHLDFYAGATLITPNHHEAEVATHLRVRSDDEARRAARAFLARTGCGGVLVTRGDQGMYLLAAEADGHLPATAREVADVTGAGDTVIATIALALSAGAGYAEAARLANEAAGIVVGRFGPATVGPAELRAAFN